MHLHIICLKKYCFEQYFLRNGSWGQQYRKACIKMHVFEMTEGCDKILGKHWTSRDTFLTTLWVESCFASTFGKKDTIK